MSNLENGRVHFLVVILFPCVFPGDPEHGSAVVHPQESGVLRALDLLHQPLLQPATSRVRHLGLANLNGAHVILTKKYSQVYTCVKYDYNPPSTKKGIVFYVTLKTNKK